MTHLLLALQSAMSTTTPDNTTLELLDASLQALGLVAFFSGKALGLFTQARRQVWLAQSKVPEVRCNNLCQLPQVACQVFSPAERRLLSAGHGRPNSDPNILGAVLVTLHWLHNGCLFIIPFQQRRQGQSYKPPQQDYRPGLSSEREVRLLTGAEVH